MLLAIAGAIAVVGAVLYGVGRYKRHHRQSAAQVIDGGASTIGNAFHGFASSGSPEDAITAGLKGMGTIAKTGLQVGSTLMFPLLLRVAGVFLVVVAVILAIVSVT